MGDDYSPLHGIPSREDIARSREKWARVMADIKDLAWRDAVVRNGQAIVDTMRISKWTIAECHLIAQYAYSRLIEVEAWQVCCELETWRSWYYGMATTSTVLRLPGVRSLVQEGRLRNDRSG